VATIAAACQGIEVRRSAGPFSEIQHELAISAGEEARRKETWRRLGIPIERAKNCCDPIALGGPIGTDQRLANDNKTPGRALALCRPSRDDFSV
jgi:hypothetical protein